jgi:hypothetical protein
MQPALAPRMAQELAAAPGRYPFGSPLWLNAPLGPLTGFWPWRLPAVVLTLLPMHRAHFDLGLQVGVVLVARGDHQQRAQELFQAVALRGTE